LFTTPTLATVVVVPTLEEMAVASDVIAEVIVGDARVVRESPGRVVTYTTLEVVDAWKGAKAKDLLEVFQLGGNLFGKSSWIVGAHRFQKGERLVFFGVRSQTRAAVVPFGIGFGLFQVKEDLTGAKVVEIVGDVAAVAPPAAPHPAHGTPLPVTAPVQRRYDTLAAFKQMVLRAERLEQLPTMPVRHQLLTQPKGR
jgi:hypothetical protein